MEHAIRHLRSAWDLQDNSLCRIAVVQDRASHSYRGRPGAEALALRDLVEEAVSLASDLLAPPYETFLRRWVATGNIAAVAREMGKDRSHLSRDYRPRVVMVVTDVFMSLRGSGEYRDANTRPRRSLRSRQVRPPTWHRRRLPAAVVADCERATRLGTRHHLMVVCQPDRSFGKRRCRCWLGSKPRCWAGFEVAARKRWRCRFVRVRGKCEPWETA